MNCFHNLLCDTSRTLHRSSLFEDVLGPGTNSVLLKLSFVEDWSLCDCISHVDDGHVLLFVVSSTHHMRHLAVLDCADSHSSIQGWCNCGKGSLYELFTLPTDLCIGIS